MARFRRIFEEARKEGCEILREQAYFLAYLWTSNPSDKKISMLSQLASFFIICN